MNSFTFTYMYGIDIPYGRDKITVTAKSKSEGIIKAIKKLRDQKRYRGYWLEILM